MSETSKKKSTGRPEMTVWSHFNKINTNSRGHYSAVCNFCNVSWLRGQPDTLEDHLATECQHCSENVREEYLTIVANRTVEKTSSRKRQKKNQTQLNEFVESTTLSNQRYNDINKALGKFIVTCSIPFSTVEHPFFIEFCKQLRPAYNPPTRNTLSNNILNSENAQIILKIQEEIQNEENITIGKIFNII